jgi:hypothetical protein
LQFLRLSFWFDQNRFLCLHQYCWDTVLQFESIMQKNLFKFQTLCWLLFANKTLSFCSTYLFCIDRFPYFLKYTASAIADLWSLELSNFSIYHLHDNNFVYRNSRWFCWKSSNILPLWALTPTEPIPNAKITYGLLKLVRWIVEKRCNWWKLLIYMDLFYDYNLPNSCINNM